MMKRKLVTTILRQKVLPLSRQLSSTRTVFPPINRIPTHLNANSYKVLSLQQQQPMRLFSTEMRAQTAAVSAANAAVAAEGAAAKAGNSKKDNNSNVFLDHLGKIFLMGIASVIATLVRSSYNTSNRNEIRDRIEDFSAMDPQELQDFRDANSELTIDVLRKLVSVYYQEFSPMDTAPASSSTLDASGGAPVRPSTTYKEFVRKVRTIMASRFPEHGDSLTIQMGHFLDRLVVDILQQRAEKQADSTDDTATTLGATLPEEEEELPVALFWVALVAAMNGSVTDRIRILHEIMLADQGGQAHGAAAAPAVPLSAVRDTVGYLQETCQLPPDTQIVPTGHKYPTQHFQRAAPIDLVPEDLCTAENTERSKTAGGDEKPGESIDLVEFAAILRTKSVCAWGECYMRLKPDASEFEEATSPSD